jgi:hypothetical protein
MPLFGFGSRSKKRKEATIPFTGVQDPHWVRGPSGGFQRLSVLAGGDEALGKGGVYVVWHAGVKPEWVWVGESDDVGDALDALYENPDVMAYEVHGGLLATWSPVAEEFRRGVVLYLHGVMAPQVPNPAVDAYDESVQPVPVLLPRFERKNEGPFPGEGPFPEEGPDTD